MKAVVLEELGKPCVVKEVPVPKLKNDSVLVKPIYSYILNFAGIIFSGKTPMKPPAPVIPGPACIATVDDVHESVLGVNKGDLVFVSPWMQSQINSEKVMQDGLIVGWFAVSPSSGKLVQEWKDGAWSERSLCCYRNVYPIPDKLKTMDLKDLSMLNWYCIAMGSIKSAGANEYGKTVLVNGASGQLGQCAVHLALACGAQKVYCLGRDIEKLKKIYKDYENDPLEFVTTDNLPQYNCDCVIDFLGMVPSAEITEKTFVCLKSKGTIVFSGGVQGTLNLPYGMILGRQLQIKGSLMYDPYVPLEILKLLERNALKLPKREFHVYPLGKVNEAIQDAMKDNKRLCLMQMNEVPK